MVTTASQDTEITLGTGRMLALFFALVTLCAVVFAMGFSVGKNSAKVQNDDLPASSVASKPEKKASLANQPAPAPQSPDMTFYKSVAQNNTNSELSPANNSGNPPDIKENPADPSAAPVTNGYYVQVAAVSKQDDAEALVDALKKKQYNAAIAQSSADKLFHVQVGPFTAIKDAEGMRTQLLGDGYNPILKK